MRAWAGTALLALLASAPGGASPAEPVPFALGAEYTEIGLGPLYAHTGVTWAKTRLEAFSWGAVEPSPPAGGRHTYVFTCTDALVREYQQAGIVNLQSYLGSSSSWGSNGGTDPMPKAANMEDFRAFVTALVERYDGDGIGDMPGLVAPIRIWVVGGEWTGFWGSGNADDYIRMLEVASAAIRAADPNARVGLIPFLLFDVFEGNVPSAQQIAQRLQDPPPVWRNSTAGLLKMLDRPELFDHVDVHALGDYTELPPTIAWLRARMQERGYQRPVFVDDAYPSSYLANFHPLPSIGWPAIYPVTESVYQQIFRSIMDVAIWEEPAYAAAVTWVRAEIAAALVKKAVVAAAEGYAGIQIGNTEDWMPDEGSGGRTLYPNFTGAASMSGLADVRHPFGLDKCLARVAGPPRPGWQALRLAASALSGFEAIEKVSGLPSGVWAYRIRKGGRATTVLWYESRTLPLAGETAPSVSVDLPVSGASEVNVVSVVPESGGSEPRVSTRSAAAGSVRLAVARLPLFVEPVDGTAAAALHVPIVLSSTGLSGSVFSSELTLANRGTSEARVRLVYTPSFGSGAGSATLDLAAGRQVVFPDAIAALRQMGVPIPAAGNQGGTLTASFTGLSAPDAGAVSARTTTAVPDGRAGLAYAGFPDGRGFDGPAYLWGLRQNAQDRSNVAVLNAGASAITLRLTVLSATATAPVFRVLPDITLGAGELRQMDGVLSSSGLALASGAVRVERVAGSAPFSAYAVINDQVSSDGSFVPPWPWVGWSRRLVLPAVVETAAFTTEVTLANPASAARKVRLTYVADAVTAPGGSAAVDVDLAPLEQVVIPSFVQLLRDRAVPGVGPPGATFAGALFVASADEVPLDGFYAAGRTLTSHGSARYGLAYAALPEEAAARRTAWLFGLKQDDANRTNLALVNLDGVPAIFDVDLFDGTTGARAGGVSGIVLGPSRWTQLGSVLLSAPGITNGYARVTRRDPGLFLAYAVVNDGAHPGERSGDGAFLEMVPGE